MLMDNRIWILDMENKNNKINKKTNNTAKLGWGFSRPPRPLGIQSLGNCAPNFNQKCEVKGFCSISYMLNKLTSTQEKAKFKPNFLFGPPTNFAIKN